jgi:hypothetical protein
MCERHFEKAEEVSVSTPASSRLQYEKWTDGRCQLLTRGRLVLHPGKTARFKECCEVTAPEGLLSFCQVVKHLKSRGLIAQASLAKPPENRQPGKKILNIALSNTGKEIIRVSNGKPLLMIIVAKPYMFTSDQSEQQHSSQHESQSDPLESSEKVHQVDKPAQEDQKVSDDLQVVTERETENKCEEKAPAVSLNEYTRDLLKLDDDIRERRENGGQSSEEDSDSPDSEPNPGKCYL